MSLNETLSGYWLHIQEELLPWLNDTPCGQLNEHHEQLSSVLGMARIEASCPAGWTSRGVGCRNVRHWLGPLSRKPCSTNRPPGR